MKNILIILVLLSPLFASSAAFAHLGGHGTFDGEKAIKLAQTSAKMLTFKANGMSVGKLDQSWTKVNQARFSVVEETTEHFIVSALNESNQQRLYFIVAKNGVVEDVKDEQSFSQAHGHTH